MNFPQSFRRDQNATSPVEFALIATVIAFALISVLTTPGTTLDGTAQAAVRHHG